MGAGVMTSTCVPISRWGPDRGPLQSHIRTSQYIMDLTRLIPVTFQRHSWASPGGVHFCIKTSIFVTSTARKKAQGWRFKARSVEICQEVCVALGDCAEVSANKARSGAYWCYPARSRCLGADLRASKSKRKHVHATSSSSIPPILIAWCKLFPPVLFLSIHLHNVS